MKVKMQNFISLGIIVILIGFTLVLIGLLNAGKDSGAKVAVGGFIGFIPFGFGNDKKLLWFVTIVSVILFLFWLFISFKTR